MYRMRVIRTAAGQNKRDDDYYLSRTWQDVLWPWDTESEYEPFHANTKTTLRNAHIVLCRNVIYVYFAD